MAPREPGEAKDADAAGQGGQFRALAQDAGGTVPSLSRAEDRRPLPEHTPEVRLPAVLAQLPGQVGAARAQPLDQEGGAMYAVTVVEGGYAPGGGEPARAAVGVAGSGDLQVRGQGRKAGVV